MTELKQCRNGKHVGPNPLPLAEFGRDRNSPGGLTRWCRACRSASAASLYEAQGETIRAAHRAYASANMEKARARKRRYRERARNKVLDHYGRVCACCGTTEQLTVDHVNGGGQQHRTETGGGSTAIHVWLIKHGFPAGFQTLCLACNSSKGEGPRCLINHAA